MGERVLCFTSSLDHFITELNYRFILKNETFFSEGEEDEEEGLDEEYDSGASGGVALTPPDSPLACRSPGGSKEPAPNTPRGKIDPEKDIYAIPSRASCQKREIYFLALVRKQQAMISLQEMAVV